MYDVEDSPTSHFWMPMDGSLRNHVVPMFCILLCYAHVLLMSCMKKHMRCSTSHVVHSYVLALH